MRSATAAAAAVGALVAPSACGERDPEYDAPIGPVEAVGLERAVALGDNFLSRVVVLQGDAEGDLSSTALPVGDNLVRMLPDVSGNRLLVLARGVDQRREAEDEHPSLTVLDLRDEPVVAARYELNEAVGGITLDPEGRWAVLAGTERGEGIVTNPNQLVLIDLSDPDFEPVTKTIRSFGAAPERFTFTPSLDVPGGQRRFLVVETSQDISLVDLADLSRPEVTIGLPQTPSGTTGRPLEVAVHAGLEAESQDALLAIRLDSDPNLVLASFTPSEEDAEGFNVTLNLVDVGSPPSELEFVETDAGLRLAALVPGAAQAALVHPGSTRVDTVPLSGAFDRLQRMTAGTGAEVTADTALLWRENSRQVAFWSLSRTTDRAFRGVDVLDLNARVSAVFDVPGESLRHRKLVQSDDARFFVLDLSSRQSFPMLSSRGNLSLHLAPDGLRAWAFAPGQSSFAQVDLETLEPQSSSIERPISALFDIASTGSQGASASRSLVALHSGGGYGATLLDARAPDTAATRFYPGLLLGGVQ